MAKNESITFWKYLREAQNGLIFHFIMNHGSQQLVNCGFFTKNSHSQIYENDLKKCVIVKTTTIQVLWGQQP